MGDQYRVEWDVIGDIAEIDYYRVVLVRVNPSSAANPSLPVPEPSTEQRVDAGLLRTLMATILRRIQ